MVTTLADREYPAGDHQVVWTGRDDRQGKVPSGVYFYHIQTRGFAETRKMALIE